MKSSEKITFLIKPGELWLKGKNRDRFVRQLLDNIRIIGEFPRENISTGQGRIYLEAPSAYRQRQNAEKLGRVFGIHSFVVAQKLALSMKDMTIAAQTWSQHWIEEGVKTFKIEASRAQKSFEKNSAEINSYLGAKLLEVAPNLRVDVHNPERTLRIEVRPEGIFLYIQEGEIKGSGGLPVGMSGRGLLLLSGGIDSPVAGWFMMKRGMSIDAVYFHSPPYVGEKTKQKVVDLAKVLAKWSPLPVRVFVSRFTEIQLAIAKAIPDPYWTIFHRRFMRRIAEELLQKEGHQALITGENLGQVASQTIENIMVAENGSAVPILRPLIGFDKTETIRLAKEISTFDISTRPYEDCCVLFSSKRPKTKARIDDVLKLEAKLSSDRLIEQSLKTMEIITVE